MQTKNLKLSNYASNSQTQFFFLILKIQVAPPLFMQKIKNQDFFSLRKQYELSFYPLFKMLILKYFGKKSNLEKYIFKNLRGD